MKNTMFSLLLLAVLNLPIFSQGKVNYNDKITNIWSIGYSDVLEACKVFYCDYGIVVTSQKNHQSTDKIYVLNYNSATKNIDVYSFIPPNRGNVDRILYSKDRINFTTNTTNVDQTKSRFLFDINKNTTKTTTELSLDDLMSSLETEVKTLTDVYQFQGTKFNIDIKQAKLKVSSLSSSEETQKKNNSENHLNKAVAVEQEKVEPYQPNSTQPLPGKAPRTSNSNPSSESEINPDESSSHKHLVNNAPKNKHITTKENKTAQPITHQAINKSLQQKKSKVSPLEKEPIRTEYYKVQFFASHSGNLVFQNIDYDIEFINNRDLYRYVTKEKSMIHSNSLLRHIQNLGYSDAFRVMYSGSKRLTN